MNVLPRYKVVRGSESGHCCFEATVIDTQSTEYHQSGDWIAECFDEKDAERICAVLNAAEENA